MSQITNRQFVRLEIASRKMRLILERDHPNENSRFRQGTVGTQEYLIRAAIEALGLKFNEDGSLEDEPKNYEKSGG